MLYTIGYRAGWTPALLLATATERQALVVDIRHNPFGGMPMWRMAALQTILGSRYRHLPALGNRNYANGGPIAIANIQVGVAVVQLLLLQQSVILLCACADAAHCHRTVVAHSLAVPVEHLVLPQAQTTLDLDI